MMGIARFGQMRERYEAHVEELHAQYDYLLETLAKTIEPCDRLSLLEQLNRVRTRLYTIGEQHRAEIRSTYK